MAQIRPILRIFDYNKAKEFYVNWLGFTIDWESKPFNDAPVYFQISLQGVIIHLSEHHGECSPGAKLYVVDFTGLKAFHEKIIAKEYKYNKPGLEISPWDKYTYTMELIDPFNNRIVLTERLIEESTM